jgi:hypothetical protein
MRRGIDPLAGKTRQWRFPAGSEALSARASEAPLPPCEPVARQQDRLRTMREHEVRFPRDNIRRDALTLPSEEYP